MREEHLQQVERWAYFVKENPEKRNPKEHLLAFTQKDNDLSGVPAKSLLCSGHPQHE